MKTTPFVEYVVHELFADMGITYRFNFGGWTLFKDKQSFAIIVDDIFYWKAGTNNLEKLNKHGKRFEYDMNGKVGYMNYYSDDIESRSTDERKKMMQESLEAKQFPIKNK